MGLAGIADAYLWGFDVDGRWRLRYDNPAGGVLAILPMGRGPRATLSEALWIADCIAFDHDAPVGLKPTRSNRGSRRLPESISPNPGRMSTSWYYDNVQLAYYAAAEIRFGEPYVLRYDDERGSPGTNFSERFAGRKNLLALYAMAARQADLLTEYLCLYRVVEAADGKTGTQFVADHLRDVASNPFGTLRVVRPTSSRGWVKAFTIYRSQTSSTTRGEWDDH